MESARAARVRIDWVDAAKAYGIFLVFYGHFVETVYETGNQAALVQQKLAYSFHVPLFILLSGFVARSAADLPGWWTFLKRQAASRLLPVLFFSLMMVPLMPLEEVLWDLMPRGPALVQAEWIDDWPDLCRQLSPPATGEQSRPRQRLWEALPAPTRAAAQKSATGTEITDGERTAIIDGLNGALARPDLFAAADYPAGTLRGKDQEWLAQDRTTTSLSLTEDEVRGRNMGLMWQALYPEHAGEHSFWSELLGRGLDTLRGWPINIPVWFLMCLFVVELIHFLVARFLTSTPRLALAIPLFYAVGWALTRNGMAWGTDWWFSRESIFLYSFFLMGHLLRRTELLERAGGWWSRGPLFVIGSAVLLLTFDLNPGSKVVKPVVLVNLSQHGDYALFTLTALAGFLAVVGLSRLAPRLPVLQFTGRRTLILMGLNGIFFNLGNPAMALVLHIPASTGPTVLWSVLATLASLAVSLPVAWLLDRYVPQLVGRPRAQGPLLPSLAA